jgi:hypothetical protein
MAEPPVMGMIVSKEGNAFGLWLLELDSGLDELSGGGGNSLELVAAAEWFELHKTGDKTVEKAARMTVSAGTAAL